MDLRFWLFFEEIDHHPLELHDPPYTQELAAAIFQTDTGEICSSMHSIDAIMMPGVQFRT